MSSQGLIKYSLGENGCILLDLCHSFYALLFAHILNKIKWGARRSFIMSADNKITKSHSTDFVLLTFS